MLPSFATLLALLLCCQAALGQEGAKTPVAGDQGTVRLWVSEKDVNSVHGGLASTDLLRELNAKCTGVVLTDNEDKADYRLEAGRAWCCTPRGESRGYKFALFNRDGDAVFSTKTHTLGNAIKDVCAAIGRGRTKSER